MWTPFQANLPVVLDRVTVMPGHDVFAASSGAVVIPDVHKPKPVRSCERKIIMSSASDGVPIPAGPERNYGERTRE
jgi:hypothetical protein